jgi:hypothetical protein
MAKIEIMDLETFDELKKKIIAFSHFVNKLNVKDIVSVFKIPYDDLGLVFTILAEENEIPNYLFYVSNILNSYPEFAQAIAEDGIITSLMTREENKPLYDFLFAVYEAAKKHLALFKKDLIDAEEMRGILTCADDLMEKKEYIPKKYIDRLFEIYAAELKENFSHEELEKVLILLISHNHQIVKERQEKLSNKKVYSKKEQEEKRKLYIETYKLPIEESVSLQTIEEVIKESYFIGVEFLQQHPSCFTSDKELYLSNIKLLRKRNIDLEVVSNRDPDAFLSKNLKENMALISNYKVDITELLCYQERALTDLSYFQVLDQMIENEMFDIRLLLDKENKKVNEKTILRLLGIPTMEIKDNFPLTKEEMDYLLEAKKVELQQGSSLLEENILDFYKIDDRTYSISGVSISRPKVLRNSTSVQNISLDGILCGGYFNEEEKEQIQEEIASLSYQKRK